MMIGTNLGFPGEVLLVTSILIWIFFLMVYLSNRKNPINRWCAISGVFFSFGVFKEYLYFTLFPQIGINEQLSLQIYSTFTACLYYLAMPSALIFAIYFHKFENTPKLKLTILKIITYIPACIFMFIYPVINTRYFQLHDTTYYLSVSFYNWMYGVLFTWFILHALQKDKTSVNYRQRYMVAIEVLIPLWYWLITAFLVHALNLKAFFKVWQGEIFIIIFLIGFFIYNVFKDGIWGARLQLEYYQWEKNQKVIHNNILFISHALKNELTKVNWCISNIESKVKEEEFPEFQIMKDSTNYMQKFIESAVVYSQDVKITCSYLHANALLYKVVYNYASIYENIDFKILCKEDDSIFCDEIHIQEVLNNLIINAIEAMHDTKGEIVLSYEVFERRKFSVITVKDTGKGISKEQLKTVFEPYVTTKNEKKHLGLGLAYCYKIMNAHQGSIKVFENKNEQGISVRLLLPYPKRVVHKRRER